jgi:chemotaxis protein methyltransferase CheR
MGLNETDFDYVRRLVYDGSAIVLEPTKTYLAETRLLQLARQEGLASVTELVARMRDSRKDILHRRVVEAMTTNETSFFRDVHPFEALKAEVVPKLIEARGDVRALNVWCAACSTGQEPYTIAMVLREHFPVLSSWNVRILATDLSRDVLEKAREGRYGQLEVNRGLPVSLLVKYFTREGLHYRVNEDLRKLIDFRELNLAESWFPMPRMDLIFLRNVLIYFDVDTKRRILARARELLRPDASLFLGGAETTINLDDSFERVVMGKASCYRLRSR